MNRPLPALAACAACAGLLVVSLTSCGEDTPSSATSDQNSSAAGSSYPVSVENCGEELTFDEPPERVVSLAQPQTDMLAALGLAGSVVGQAQLAPPDDLPGGSEELAAESDIPVIVEDSVPAKEVTIAQEPDLVIAPTVFEFESSEGFATQEDLNAAGATTYLAAGGCADNRLSRSVEDTVTDLTTYGEVFGVQDEAEELADAYGAQLEEVSTALAGTSPVRVAEVFVFGSDVESLAGSSGNDLVKAAGGENVFASDDPGFDGNLFASLSPEVVAAQQPEAFVFSAGSEEDVEEVKEQLRSTFPTTPAVENDLLVGYSSTAGLPGSLTVPEAVRFVAQQLHPDAF